MSRIKFAVLFYVRKMKSSDNQDLSLYARISMQGKRVDFSLNKNVNPGDWDPSGGCVQLRSKESKELNYFIEKVRLKISRIKLDLEERSRDVTPEIVRDVFLGQDETNKGILQLFDEHNEKAKKLVDIDFADGTVERYLTCRKHVADFILKNYKKDELPLKDINHQFIKDFEFYLKTVRKCCHNTTTKYIKNFKKIIRIAQANDLIKIDPFRNIKFHLDDVDMAYLTESELNTLMKKEFAIERLQVVRDIYLFCCFTGLAFIDVKNLKKSDIEDKDGRLWVVKRRQKTKNWCNVPLLQPAVQLLNKYKNHPKCVNSEFALPVSSNQKMNAYLREIADICEIKKHLSTHTARHTFATTVTLANQISMEVVSKMLGHSSINMTKKYARVVDDLINRDMQKIFGKYETVIMN